MSSSSNLTAWRTKSSLWDSSIPLADITLSKTSSLHLKPAPGSSSESAESSDEDSSSVVSSAAVGMSSSTSSPNVTPWNWFRTSASTSPSPLISKDTSKRSPFSTTGIDQTFSVPLSPDVDSRLTSSLFLPPSPLTIQSLRSKLEGRTSLIQTSWRAVSPLFSKIIKTSYRPFPPIGITDLPAEKFLRLCLTLTTGTSSTSRVQTGPNLSALNSQRAGPATASFPGLGSGATSG